MMFDLNSARTYARAGKTEAWIHAYLTQGTWANPGLAFGLQRAPRWWIGPVELALDTVRRVCGPEVEMEYPQPPANWEARVGQICASFTTLDALPPLIIEFRTMTIRDGNHRHEALRRLGFAHCYAFIWYDDRETYTKNSYLQY
jgi:hypothetical protein